MRNLVDRSYAAAWLAGLGVLLIAHPAFGHEGPDPAARWQMTPNQLNGQTLQAIIGPDATLEGDAEIEQIDIHGALTLDGADNALVVAADLDDVREVLPTEPFTIMAVAAVNRPERWGECAATRTGVSWLCGRARRRGRRRPDRPPSYAGSG